MTLTVGVKREMQTPEVSENVRSCSVVSPPTCPISRILGGLFPSMCTVFKTYISNLSQTDTKPAEGCVRRECSS